MKVVIHSEKKKLFILFPTTLLLNRFTAAIATKMIKRKWPSIDISTRDSLKLIATIKEYRKNNKHWELIHISFASGDIIYIRL